MATIRVFLCDDHEILRKGLRALLETEPDIQWVGDAGDGEGALAQLAALSPDVILTDLLMPGLSEVELIRQLKRAAPASKILVLTSSQEEDLILGSLEAGASGYLLKNCSPEALIQSIRALAAGGTVLPPQLAGQLPGMLQHEQAGKLLTRREIEVLHLIGAGQSNRMIAEALHLSENTVISHVAHILSKLGLENRTQAALYARRRGLV